ncbi:uncharacterized protein LOC131943479 [Physella acuta]|uniref:uncharacterized protein LOC131943479 n=1 Tax=Physella acuta TaxID=109671 RepID=UPI0027DDFB10|nr:uncharacterized protein LOC131943479 [Physella acuta]
MDDTTCVTTDKLEISLSRPFRVLGVTLTFQDDANGIEVSLVTWSQGDKSRVSQANSVVRGNQSLELLVAADGEVKDIQVRFMLDTVVCSLHIDGGKVIQDDLHLTLYKQNSPIVDLEHLAYRATDGEFKAAGCIHTTLADSLHVDFPGDIFIFHVIVYTQEESGLAVLGISATGDVIQRTPINVTQRVHHIHVQSDVTKLHMTSQLSSFSLCEIEVMGDFLSTSAIYKSQQLEDEVLNVFTMGNEQEETTQGRVERRGGGRVQDDHQMTLEDNFAWPTVVAIVVFVLAILMVLCVCLAKNFMPTEIKGLKGVKEAYPGLYAIKQAQDLKNSKHKGKRKVDKTKVDKTKVDKTKVDKTKKDKARVDETKVDKTKVDKTKVNKTKKDKTKKDKTKKDKTRVDETKVDKTRVDKTRVDKTRVDKARVDKTRVDQEAGEMSDSSIEESSDN